MIRKYIIVADDSFKGFDKEIARLEREWGAEEIEPSEDCISRDEVLKLVDQYPHIIGNRYSGLMTDIKHLPPVTPQRPKGKWIHWTDDYKDYCTCSECDYGEEGEVLLKDKTPYCPICGSYNGGSEDEDSN